MSKSRPDVLFEATFRDCRTWESVAQALVAAPVYGHMKRTPSAQVVAFMDLIVSDGNDGAKILVALGGRRPQQLCAVLVENEGRGPFTDIAHDLELLKYNVSTGAFKIRMSISSVEHIPKPEWAVRSSDDGAEVGGHA